VEVIRSGGSGDAVRDVQLRLLGLGAEIDTAELETRSFRVSTEEAVRWFQRTRGLPEDGLVGPDTWGQIVEAGYVLGDRTLYLRVPAFRGDDVRALQRSLNALGFDAGREDGILGEATDRAVRDFQRNVGRPVDGIVGSETLAAIERLRPQLEAPSRAIVREEEAVRAMVSTLEGSVVAIDPGTQDDLALELAAALAKALEPRGAQPVLLAAEPLAPSDRARRANAAACISLRFDPDAAGGCFYYGTERTHSPAGKRLAELISDQLEKLWGARDVRRRSVAILRETRMPTVQIEPPANLDGTGCSALPTRSPPASSASSAPRYRPEPNGGPPIRSSKP